MPNDRNAGRKKALLPEAIKELYYLNQSGISMNDLAKQAGVSRQTLSGYFSSIKNQDFLVEASSGNSYNLVCRSLAYWKQLNNEFIRQKKLSEAEISDYSLKYDYMNRDKLTSEILVNTKSKTVKVINHSNDTIHLAFGANQIPDWNDLLSFLEERCFPESRDRLKEILSYYNLDSFDIFSLIEETGGVMAEDHQWIKVTHFNNQYPINEEVIDGKN